MFQPENQLDCQNLIGVTLKAFYCNHKISPLSLPLFFILIYILSLFIHIYSNMTVRSNDTDFSYLLTESILSKTPNSNLSSKQGNITSSDSLKGAPDYNTNNNILQQQATPRLVTPLPHNSIVIQPKDSDSSFNNYIGNHFKEDAPVLLDRLSVASPIPPAIPHNPTLKKSESTFWAYLSNDLDGRPPPTSSDISIKQYNNNNNNNNNTKDTENQNTWYEYDSIFAGQTSSYTTATHFFSVGAFLFLFGFICPPLWWVGSFCPTRVDDRYQKKHDVDIKMIKRWRTLNRFFSLGFSTLLVIAIIVLTVIYSKT